MGPGQLVHAAIVVALASFVFAVPGHAVSQNQQSSPPLAKHALLKQPWNLLESENFSLMTNTDKAEARAMLADLEQFRRVVLYVTGGGAEREPGKVRVVVFANTRQFKRIAYKHDIAGYLRPSLRGTRLVTSRDALGTRQREALFHEYVHHLVKVSAAVNYPAWYDEGLADMLATTHVDDDRIIVGSPSKIRSRVLHNNPYEVGLSRILNVQDMNEVHGFQVGYFLGVSWAFTNFLHFGHLAGGPDRLPMLKRYFELKSQLLDDESAFAEAFGVSTRTMERELTAFLKRKRHPVLSLAQTRYRYQGDIVHVAMSQSEAALELISQALLGNPKLARQLAEHALRVDPGNPRLSSAHGLTWLALEEFDKAERLVRDAYQRDQSDPVLAINYADVLLNWNRAACSSSAQTQARKETTATECDVRLATARAVYLRALHQTPQNPELRNRYGTLLLTQFAEYDDAIKHLRFALNFQRWNSTLHLRIGLAHHGNGDRDEAIAQLKKALYWAESSNHHKHASSALVQLAGQPHPQP